jgi:hypothetical protein
MTVGRRSRTVPFVPDGVAFENTGLSVSELPGYLGEKILSLTLELH